MRALSPSKNGCPVGWLVFCEEYLSYRNRRLVIQLWRWLPEDKTTLYLLALVSARRDNEALVAQLVSHWSPQTLFMACDRMARHLGHRPQAMVTFEDAVLHQVDSEGNWKDDRQVLRPEGRST